MPISAHERRSRFKIGFVSLLAYLAGYPILYAFDANMFQAITGDIRTLFIHGHIALLIVGALWILGREWLNPIVVILLLIDLLIVARERVTWGALLVTGLGMVSCAYAAYRTYLTLRDRAEELSHDA